MTQVSLSVCVNMNEEQYLNLLSTADHEPIFRQESNFHWAFGVREPDCYGTIEYPSGRSTLFVPRLPESYAVWMGPIKTLDWWKNEYLVDEVKYVDELSDFIIAFGKTVSESEATLLYLLYGLNSDSKKYAKPAHFDGIDQFEKDMDALFPAIVEMRVFKTEKELAVLRYVSHVSSDAHMAVLQHAKPGMKEYQLESLFRHWCYYHGKCRNMSYTCICASGINGAVLHYGHAGEPNKKELFPTDICLFDMGGEYHCYGADITTSFPATGRFNEDQKLIYNTVLAAVYAVEDAMKEGVSWVDMHALAYRTILEELKKGGVLVGSVDEMMSPEVNLGAIFMPHGLGHFLGIDTHDVGGYPPGLTRPNLAGFSSLRTARVLKSGMYITVEPGCYFIGALLDKALQDPVQSKYLVPEKIEHFRKFGGKLS